MRYFAFFNTKSVKSGENLILTVHLCLIQLYPKSSGAVSGWWPARGTVQPALELAIFVYNLAILPVIVYFLYYIEGFLEAQTVRTFLTPQIFSIIQKNFFCFLDRFSRVWFSLLHLLQSASWKPIVYFLSAVYSTIIQLQGQVTSWIYETMHFQGLILDWLDLNHIPEICCVHKLKFFILHNAPSINSLR